jgi:hypothetical protein
MLFKSPEPEKGHFNILLFFLDGYGLLACSYSEFNVNYKSKGKDGKAHWTMEQTVARSPGYTDQHKHRRSADLIVASSGI